MGARAGYFIRRAVSALLAGAIRMPSAHMEEQRAAAYEMWHHLRELTALFERMLAAPRVFKRYIHRTYYIGINNVHTFT